MNTHTLSYRTIYRNTKYKIIKTRQTHRLFQIVHFIYFHLRTWIYYINYQNYQTLILTEDNQIVIVIVINCFVCMTASFYSITKACIWQSKYRTNSTNNNLEKFSYITNNESRIFIQEETNFISNLFTWCFFEFIISHAFWRWFLVKVRYYSIDLINKGLSLYWIFVTLKEEMNLIFYLISVT